MKVNLRLTAAVSSFFIIHSAFAFEGRIAATLTRGGQPADLLYTAGTNCLRVENTATNWPNPVNLMDRHSGALTLLVPNNRSFVHLRQERATVMVAPVGAPPTGSGEPGADANASFTSAPDVSGRRPTTAGEPRALPKPAGAPARPPMPPLPAAGGMPAMPMMPMPMEKMELQATGETTNLLGYACARYEIKQRGETLEVWATDQLLPFQPYVPSQPHRFGPQMIEEQWGKLVQAQKLFPLLATLTFDNGSEHLRFEVKTVTAQKFTSDDAALFQPPPEYLEIQPLPF